MRAHAHKHTRKMTPRRPLAGALAQNEEKDRLVHPDTHAHARKYTQTQTSRKMTPGVSSSLRAELRRRKVPSDSRAVRKTYCQIWRLLLLHLRSRLDLLGSHEANQFFSVLDVRHLPAVIFGRGHGGSQVSGGSLLLQQALGVDWGNIQPGGGKRSGSASLLCSISLSLSLSLLLPVPLPLSLQSKSIIYCLAHSHTRTRIHIHTCQ